MIETVGRAGDKTGPSRLETSDSTDTTTSSSSVQACQLAEPLLTILLCRGRDSVGIRVRRKP
jgi:hypothetical protein